MAGASLVTGGAGFAGSHLVEHLLLRESSVEAWTNPGGRPPPSTDHRVRWRAVDVLDRRGVAATLAEIAPSTIYHCAGIADVGTSRLQPEKALAVNALGTLHLIDGARAAGLRCPILVTGSALVYRPSSEAMTEDWPVAPAHSYGVSKLAQEMAARRDPGQNTFIVRPFNHAGPRQSPSFVTSTFAQQIAEIEAGLREPTMLVGNLDAKRDITDVRDVVRAYAMIVERGQPGRPYNVCSGSAYRVGDLLDQLVAMSGVQVSVQIDSARLRPSDNPVIVGDRSRLTNEVGWEPSIPIARTLADLLEFWRVRTRRS